MRELIEEKDNNRGEHLAGIDGFEPNFINVRHNRLDYMKA
jgi:hypothetical protein